MNPSETATTAPLDQAVADFLAVRQRLFGIAYRIVGNAPGAEDVVQEVWIRWQTSDRASVRRPEAYLAATTEHLAINEIHSAHARRDTALDPSMAAPVDETTDPELGAERSEAVEAAMTILVERLTPRERAAYVLREAFGYSYGRIADIVRATEPTARQLVSRARHHLTGAERAAANDAERRRLVAAFRAASMSGDVATLEGLFRARRRRDIRSADVTTTAPALSSLAGPNAPSSPTHR
ncbi:sigma-70 family RNA polymerase sigma factor [Agromyces sp. NPDC055520]